MVKPAFLLPQQPVSFILHIRLAMTTREPCRQQARLLQPGQSLRLRREPENPHDCQAIRVETLTGNAVGYLYAETASCLAILLDNFPGINDQSTVWSVLNAPPPDDPAAKKMRYPQVVMRLHLDLTSAWPLFTMIAVLGIKAENFAARFNLSGNPWLLPLLELHEQYLREGHDQFCLPRELAQAWIVLTGKAK